ncbi:MAG TPA: amidohydrolase family protein [Steroidobacteraceae bacterium]|nr:amidohydrolase family protein [Steroidobacteraceae bacterium]
MSTVHNWLDKVQEAALEPNLPIIDPHHHLWDYPKVTGGRYLLDELLTDTNSGHNIVATVFMECGSMFRAGGPESLRPIGETEFVQGIAAMSASGTYGKTQVAAGIVGFSDLSLGAAVRDVLEAHLDASPNRFRGIRHAAGWHASDEIRNSHSNPSQGLLLQKRFREGFAQLRQLNLSFDAWLYHPQIPELTDLARAFPETTIVLDHFGGPLGIGPYAGKADEVFIDWRKSIDELAKCPNVVAKLGGINMAINGFAWHKKESPPTSEELVAATKRYYLHMIEKFGVERCMFESNFPVDKISCSYAVLWNSFKRLTKDFSAIEKAALFYNTVKRVYRLSDL